MGIKRSGTSGLYDHYNWHQSKNLVWMSLIEISKEKAAHKVVEECIINANPRPKYIGIGSGTTIVYAIEKLSTLSKDLLETMIFIPTSFQSQELLSKYNLNCAQIDQYLLFII